LIQVNAVRHKRAFPALPLPSLWRGLMLAALGGGIGQDVLSAT
jgi:hypothetical protein